MNINKSSFGLRPIREPSGRIYIREVYYNDRGRVCDIEMQIKHTYFPDPEKAIDTLSGMYYNIKEYKMYNPNIIDYDPMVDKLAEWTLEDVTDDETLESTE